MRVAIIGAGPSALVTAKTLLEEADKDPGFNPDITVFEAEDKIGGTFRYRAYSNATLVSSKQLTSFSDFRLPLEHHDHLSLPEYVQYLEDYTSHFKLRQRCNFRMQTKVLSVKRVHGGHLVESAPTDDPTAVPTRELFTHLCVCSGLHVEPAVPEIPGLPPVMKGDQIVSTTGAPQREKATDEAVEQDKDAGKTAADILTLHSSQFKDRSLFAGKRVMVLGTGETGMDMAYEAVKGGATEIVLCTRAGFLMFPAVLADFVVLGSKYDGNLPIDGLITNLFETAYVHPWVAASHLRWFVSDFVIKRVLWALTGTQADCNQWVGELEPERLGRAYTFLNKSSKAMPYINRGWKNRPWLFEKFASYLDPPTVLPEEPSVDLAPFPSHVTAEGRVVFRRNERKEDYRMRHRSVRPDVVVYATGYKQNFDFLSEDYPVPATVRCRDVFDPSDPTVSFIGFVRPGVGAIPPIAEMQAQLWTLVIRGKLAPPTSTPHYYLLVKESARIKYGVDYSTYVSTLARDMGSAPGLGQLLWQYGFKVTLIYCFCAAFTTIYRLVGPWRHPDAKRIVETEIYDTIKRRGVAGNLTMGLIPMIFYAIINATAYVLEKSLRVAVAITRPFLIQPQLRKARAQPASATPARRFQSDFAPPSASVAEAPGRSGGNVKQAPRGKLLRFFALLTGVLAMAANEAQANTEIRNFGPVLCRADEYGHLAATAAEQLSSTWPVLTPSTTPNLFTVNPEHASSSVLLESETASRLGAWLVLDVANRGEFKLPLPDTLADPDHEAPRDRLLRRAWNTAYWSLFRRFTLRLSYSAHVPTRFHMEIFTPEEALKKGGVAWEAEKLGERVEERGDAPGRTSVAGAVSTAAAAASGQADAGVRQHGESDDGAATVVVPRKAVPSAAEEGASPADPSSLTAPDGINDDILYPCPRLYLHLVAFVDGVPVPARRERLSPPATFADRLKHGLFDLSEATIGRLAPGITPPPADGEGDGERPSPLPIHLTLESLQLGVVPSTALQMLYLLIPAAMVGYLYILPTLRGLVDTPVTSSDGGGRLKAE